MNRLKTEYQHYKLLLRSVPSLAMTFFVASVILMNLLANREIALGIDWLALDCGFLVSWISFLAMDMLTKRFGAKASIELSLTAIFINLLVSIILNFVTKVPGNWGAFYDFGETVVNIALDDTIAGTWYVVVGSTVAFIISAILNALLNAGIGKLTRRNSFGAFALRSYISTGIAQFVDNLVFALLVSHIFFGWSMLQVITCSITGGLAELIFEIIFSPIGYKVCKKWEAENVGEKYLNR